MHVCVCMLVLVLVVQSPVMLMTMMIMRSAAPRRVLWFCGIAAVPGVMVVGLSSMAREVR